MSKYHIESIFESHTADKSVDAIPDGVRQASEDIEALMQSKKMPLSECHLVELMNQTCAYKGTALHEKYGRNGIEVAAQEGAWDKVSEAIAASGDFNNLFTKMIHNTFIPGYESALVSLEPLFTRMPSDTRIQYHGGIDAADEPERIPEGTSYPEKSPTEKYVQIENHKVGDTTGITKETILYDKTGGQLMTSIADRRDEMERMIRRWILSRVQDIAFTTNNFNLSASTSLQINGTTRAIYSSNHSSWDNGQSNDNVVASTSGDITSTILQSGYTLLANMTNIHGRKLGLTAGADTLLINSDKYFKTTNLVNASGSYENANTDANVVNIVGVARNIVHSPEVGTTTYFQGDFKRQFVLQEVQKISVQAAGAELTKGVLRKFIMDGIIGIGAREYRRVIKYTN